MGHVHTRAAAVIRLIDAVTERAVQHGGVQLQTVQQHKVIWKDTDCAVILEQGRPAVRSYIGSTADDPDRGRRIDLLISGKYYQEVRLHIDRTADAAPAVYPVWLQPSRQYPFQLYSSQKDITVIQGVHDPAEVLYVLWPAEGDRYKLAETTVAGAVCISLWGADGVPDGRTLLLCEGSDQKELVTLSGQTQDGTYMYDTREQIRHVFHRGRAKVYKALRLHMDDSGNFYTAFRRRTDGEILFWRGGAEAGFADVSFSACMPAL